jgi:uncharacterized protein YjbI with pentapeptide repeats
MAAASSRRSVIRGGIAGRLQPRSRLVQRAAIKLRPAECCSHERPNLNNPNLNNPNLNNPNLNNANLSKPNRRPMHLDC